MTERCQHSRLIDVTGGHCHPVRYACNLPAEHEGPHRFQSPLLAALEGNATGIFYEDRERPLKFTIERLPDSPQLVTQ